MWRFDGRFDPETGLRMHTRLAAATQQLFAEQVPAEAPADLVERQAFLRARGWIALLDSTTHPASASPTGTGTSNQFDRQPHRRDRNRLGPQHQHW